MYTRLSFLDEATACAAGHRPCGKCRHPEMKAFHEHWLKRHPHDTTMSALDARLHEERTRPVRQTAVCADLQRGAIVSLEGRQTMARREGMRVLRQELRVEPVDPRELRSLTSVAAPHAPTSARSRSTAAASWTASSLCSRDGRRTHTTRTSHARGAVAA